VTTTTTGGGASCAGTPIPCSAYSIPECSVQPGCGTPACCPVNAQPSCSNDPSCQVCSQTGTRACTGKTQTTCVQVPGCKWL
jgi:hypothetical protein